MTEPILPQLKPILMKDRLSVLFIEKGMFPARAGMNLEQDAAAGPYRIFEDESFERVAGPGVLFEKFYPDACVRMNYLCCGTV